MIRVFVEVHEEVAPRRVEVRPESISQAVRTIEEVHPDRAVQVLFPIEPEEFFIEDYGTRGRAFCSDRLLRRDAQQAFDSRDSPTSRTTRTSSSPGFWT